MNITLRQLQVFSAVAQHQSFTKAAQELHLTQPAVSMQVKQLETQVGLPIVEQIGKRIFLTDAGQELSKYTKQILNQLKELETVLDEMKGLEGGRLSIAVASTANYFAANLLAKFAKKHPSVAVNLVVTNRESLIRLLAENETDLVIMGQPPSDLDLVANSFMDNPLVVIAPPDHSLAQARSIPLKDLTNEPFILREEGSGTRLAWQRFCSSHQFSPRRGMEMNATEAIKQSVQAGLGLGVVSRHSVELEFETGRLVELHVAHTPIMRQWHLVHLREKRLSSAALAFKSFLLNEKDG